MLLAKSELLEFLHHLPEEAVAAILILSVIFSFITVLVTTLSVVDSYKTITLARMSKDMIEDLLAKGYSPSEIEPLVNGNSNWKKMRKLFAFARDRHDAQARGYHGRPMPPVKHG